MHGVRRFGWLGQRQGEVHHGIEFERLVADIGEGHLGSHLELKDVRDTRIVPSQVARPRLRGDHLVALPLRGRIFHNGARVGCSVHVLVKTVEEEREHFMCVVLKTTGKFGPPFGDDTLEFGRDQDRVTIGPHRIEKIRHTLHQATLHTQGCRADFVLEVSRSQITPQRQSVRQGLQRRVHEASVANILQAAGSRCVTAPSDSQGTRGGGTASASGLQSDHEVNRRLRFNVVL
mmetsp:Transcript_66066/g.175078  ORF Transcript_66066/g.175078 Transcript_66066/m.175078 type:complete len:233 (+) Transcript_66066:1406-2104(+)